MSSTQYTIRQFSSSLVLSGRVMPYLSSLLVYSLKPKNRWTISPYPPPQCDSGIGISSSESEPPPQSGLLTTRLIVYLILSNPQNGRIMSCPGCPDIAVTRNATVLSAR